MATSQASILAGEREPHSVFGLTDSIVVYTYVTWPDVSAAGGTRHVAWQWFRGEQLVSQTRNVVVLKSTPAELWTRRSAASLGVGDYRVETRVDDQLLSTNRFKIDASVASSGYDPAVAQATCKVPASYVGSRLALLPVVRERPAFPGRAAVAGVEGCAVVTAAIDQVGAPVQVALVAEYPPGFGFGNAALDAVRGTTYRRDTRAGSTPR